MIAIAILVGVGLWVIWSVHARRSAAPGDSESEEEASEWEATYVENEEATYISPRGRLYKFPVNQQRLDRIVAEVRREKERRAEEENTAIYICPRGRLYEFPGVSQERCDAMVARVRRENYLRMKMKADVEDSMEQEFSTPPRSVNTSSSLSSSSSSISGTSPLSLSSSSSSFASSDDKEPPVMRLRAGMASRAPGAN